MGLATAAVGVAPSLPLALAAAVVLGLSSGVFGTIVYALLLDSTPAAEVGRVMALLSLVLESSAALSFLVTGVLTTTFDSAAPFLLGGLAIAVTALTGVARPHVRRLQLRPGTVAHEVAVEPEVLVPQPVLAQT
jgi:MFS family permease